MSDKKMFLAAKIVRDECKKRATSCIRCPMRSVCEIALQGIKQIPRNWNLKN